MMLDYHRQNHTVTLHGYTNEPRTYPFEEWLALTDKASRVYLTYSEQPRGTRQTPEVVNARHWLQACFDYEFPIQLKLRYIGWIKRWRKSWFRLSNLSSRSTQRRMFWNFVCRDQINWLFYPPHGPYPVGLCCHCQCPLRDPLNQALGMCAACRLEELRQVKAELTRQHQIEDVAGKCVREFRSDHMFIRRDRFERLGQSGPLVTVHELAPGKHMWLASSRPSGQIWEFIPEVLGVSEDKICQVEQSKEAVFMLDVPEMLERALTPA